MYLSIYLSLHSEPLPLVEDVKAHIVSARLIMNVNTHFAVLLKYTLYFRMQLMSQRVENLNL